MSARRQAADERLFPGDSEMARRMRAFDWSRTPLGPVDSWSPALRTMVRILLVNRFPMLLWWGPRYIQLYNDAYLPIPGDKHPSSMGQPASECWPEIWHVIGPLVDTPFHGGPSTWMEDIFLEIRRQGRSAPRTEEGLERLRVLSSLDRPMFSSLPRDRSRINGK